MKTLRFLSAALLLLGTVGGCGGDDPAAPGKTFAPPAFQGRWGSTGSGSGQFFRPAAVATGPDGRVYVADLNNDRIQVFDADGAHLATWDKTGFGASELFGPDALAVGASGKVFVGDLGIDVVDDPSLLRTLTADGQFLEEWPFHPDKGGLATDRDGNLYLSGSRIYELSGNKLGDGPFVWKLAPDGTILQRWTHMERGPVAVSADGDIFVAQHFFQEPDPESYARISRFAPDGTFLDQWAVAGGEPATVSALCADSVGNLYVCERTGGRILQYDFSGKLLVEWSDVDENQEPFRNPEGAAVNMDDRLYVTDSQLDRVYYFAYEE